MIEPEFLNGILAAASDVAFVMSRAGEIKSVLVDPRSPYFGRIDTWQGQSILNVLAPDSIGKVDHLLQRLAQGETAPAAIEVNHRDGGHSFPIRYTLHPVGRDGELLLLGRDLQQIAETQQQLVQAQIALERGYEERREFDARYRMLLSITRDPVAFVSVSDGRIKDLNAPAAALLGGSREELTGAQFAQEFKDRRRGEFVENLISLAISESTTDLTVVTRRSRQDVRIFPSVFRAAGERLLLCRLEAEVQGEALDDRLASDLVALYRQGTDAVVFTDAKGAIDEANEAFLELVDAAHMSELRGRSLSDYLARGQIDMSVMLENAVRAGHMRIYATRLTNDLGAKTSVEISVAYLNGRDRPSVAFVLRDASRAEALRAQTPVLGPDDVAKSSVIELVGTTSLKEIVAETSDVIEKMCIQAAVDLTRNNRAAAAEMLGLSRQSLYVKLRKYDLLNKYGE